MKNNFAPVLVCTLNRYEKFRSCIESLKMCVDAFQTDLYICLDYPTHDSHWPGYILIKKYMTEINGFKTINITIRERNFGVNDNWDDMMNLVFNSHHKIIISEDDNVFSVFFLQFMNAGLNLYENKSDIFSVSGYNLPNDLSNSISNEVYLTTSFFGWGVGLWKKKWHKVNFSIESYCYLLEQPQNIKLIKSFYRSHLHGFYVIRDSRKLTVDGLLFLYMLHNKMYSIAPIKSLVRNTGHDNTGVNGVKSSVSNQFLNQEINEVSGNHKFDLSLKVNFDLINKINNYRKISIFELFKIYTPYKLKVYLKKLIYHG